MLKTGMRPGRTRAGSASPRASCGWPSTRAGAPPVSSPFATTSTVSGVPASTCMPDHDGVEPRAEVVDVRDDDRRDAAALELGERAGRANRREHVAVTRPVERRRPVLLDEHAAVGPQARRSGLAEPERLAEPLLGDVRADDLVRGEARHHRDGNLGAERRAEAGGLAELDLEEAPAVDRLGDRLDAAAEARRHSAREHDHRDRARRERRPSRPRPPRRSPGRPAPAAQQIRRQRRLDHALDDVAGGRQRAVGEPARSSSNAPRRIRAPRASRARPGSTSSRITASPPARAATRRTGPGGCPPRSRSP